MGESRTCILCGKQVDAGMTNNEGIYAHEECFDDMMNAVYPYGWRLNPSGEIGSRGGYYQAKESPADNWHDTGVFYTEWEKDDAPIESEAMPDFDIVSWEDGAVVLEKGE